MPRKPFPLGEVPSRGFEGGRGPRPPALAGWGQSSGRAGAPGRSGPAPRAVPLHRCFLLPCPGRSCQSLGSTAGQNDMRPGGHTVTTARDPPRHRGPQQLLSVSGTRRPLRRIGLGLDSRRRLGGRGREASLLCVTMSWAGGTHRTEEEGERGPAGALAVHRPQGRGRREGDRTQAGPVMRAASERGGVRGRPGRGAGVARS